MTASTLVTTTTTQTNTLPQEDASLKSRADKETAKARRDAFSRLRTLSNSFSKQRCSHNRRVHFDFTKTQVHTLSESQEERAPMFMSYQDKVSTADDVEETCYQFNDSDYVHPYVMHLISTWDACATMETKSGNPIRPLDWTTEELTKLTHSKARGLEKKLYLEMKRQRESVIKQVMDTQKSYKQLPMAARLKMIKNKYKKLSTQSKCFALTMALGDQHYAQKLHQGNTVAAISA